MAVFALVLATAVVLVLLYLSRIPVKVLVFPDHLLIKSFAYRSRRFEPADLAEISTPRFPQVWLRMGIFRCVALAFGLVGPGIYLRPWSGRTYFFRTRHTEELIVLLSGWRVGTQHLDSVSKVDQASTRLGEGEMKELLRNLYVAEAPGVHKPSGG
jgi:hypothetical protein